MATAIKSGKFTNFAKFNPSAQGISTAKVAAAINTATKVASTISAPEKKQDTKNISNNEKSSFDLSKILKLLLIIGLIIGAFYLGYFLGTSGIYLYIILAIVAFFIYKKPESFGKFLLFLTYCALLVIIPFALIVYAKVTNPLLALLGDFAFIILIITKDKKVGLQLLLVFLVLMPIGYQYVNSEAFASTGLGQTLEPISFGKTNMIKEIKSAIERVTASVKRDIALAGGMPDSVVDSGAKKTLGIFPSEIETTRKPAVFIAGESLDFYTKIKAQSLDFPVNLKLACKIDDMQGKVTPETAEFFAKAASEEDSYDYSDVDCILSDKDSIKLKQGSHTVKIIGNFNFATRAYLDVYFIDNQKLKDLERRNLLSQMQSNLLPSAISAITTSGPIKIGLSAGKSIVGISPSATGPTVGVSIQNIHKGNVQNIKNIIVMLPKGLSVVSVNGKQDISNKISCFDLSEIEQKGCDDKFMEIYIITPSEQAIAEIKNPYDFSNFRLQTKISDYGTLLSGGATILPKKIRAAVEYDYQIAQEKSFSIRAPIIT